MDVRLARQSAEIYTFPPRGRFAANVNPEHAVLSNGVQLPRGVKLVTGTSWYHDEAIRESLIPEPLRTGPSRKI
jgi:hypothetical protein